MAKSYQEMNFSEIVGLLNEPNRPSGGTKTIQEVIHHSLIGYRSNPKILEIGSNTGFSSIEFGALLPHAEVIGIDINVQSVSSATRKAEKCGLRNVVFQKADGQKLPFEDEAFDLVFCSNTTSFINDKQAAVKEYFRVLRPRGICAVAPIYYGSEPPLEIVKEVEKAIGTALTIRSAEDRKALFTFDEGYIFYNTSHSYCNISDDKLREYTDYVMGRSNLEGVSDKDREFLWNKLYGYYKVFNENLKYCKFDVFLIMKGYPNSERELYLTDGY